MKSILLFITILFAGFLLKAQQTQLTGSTWNIEKVTLNNIDYLYPPNIYTPPGPLGTAIFTSGTFSSSICNWLSAFVTYNNDQITFISSGLSLGSCPLEYNAYNVFESYYFGQFFGSNTANGIYSTYNYQIVAISNQLRLTLTNPNGDKAVYWSGNLSVNDNIETKLFKVYPNPIKNILKISTKSAKVDIQLYDMQGRLVLEKDLQKNINSDNFELDMSVLDKGIYFLMINKEIKYKIIKE